MRTVSNTSGSGCGAYYTKLGGARGIHFVPGTTQRRNAATQLGGKVFRTYNKFYVRICSMYTNVCEGGCVCNAMQCIVWRRTEAGGYVLWKWLRDYVDMAASS